MCEICDLKQIWASDLFASYQMGRLHLHPVFLQVAISLSNLAKHLIFNIAGKISHINLQLIT